MEEKELTEEIVLKTIQNKSTDMSPDITIEKS